MNIALSITPTRIFEALKFCAMVCLFGLVGQLRLPLPFTPVPLVWQVNLALLLGALLGARKAIAVLLVSYFLTMMGIPMLSGGVGVASFFGPTAGYRLGYLAGAYIMGMYRDGGKLQKALPTYLYFLVANLSVFALGLPYLSLFVGYNSLLWMGLIPFLPGMLLKDIVMTKLYLRLKGETT